MTRNSNAPRRSSLACAAAAAALLAAALPGPAGADAITATLRSGATFGGMSTGAAPLLLLGSVALDGGPGGKLVSFNFTGAKDIGLNAVTGQVLVGLDGVGIGGGVYPADHAMPLSLSQSLAIGPGAHTVQVYGIAGGPDPARAMFFAGGSLTATEHETIDGQPSATLRTGALGSGMSTAASPLQLLGTVALDGGAAGKIVSLDFHGSSDIGLNAAGGQFFAALDGVGIGGAMLPGDHAAALSLSHNFAIGPGAHTVQVFGAVTGPDPARAMFFAGGSLTAIEHEAIDGQPSATLRVGSLSSGMSTASSPLQLLGTVALDGGGAGKVVSVDFSGVKDFGLNAAGGQLLVALDGVGIGGSPLPGDHVLPLSWSQDFAIGPGAHSLQVFGVVTGSDPSRAMFFAGGSLTAVEYETVVQDVAEPGTFALLAAALGLLAARRRR